MKNATLHIKFTSDLADRLKKIARRRKVPVGELVREAVSSRYQIDIANLPQRQSHALYAYQGRYISLGKLAEEIGLNPLEMRDWLVEHGISQNNCYRDGDSVNACNSTKPMSQE